MKVFDTDILTEILAGNAAYADRLAQVPASQQAVCIITIEEVLRGRLNTIRQAEAGKGRVTLDRAYGLFAETLLDVREVRILPYTPTADALFRDWRKQKVKGSTHDLRIAASCIAHGDTLVTRNRRDFQDIPGLAVEVWE